jgi:hypothetical protein
MESNADSALEVHFNIRVYHIILNIKNLSS